jgi:mono/diheme cytochrome c family protein
MLIALDRMLTRMVVACCVFVASLGSTASFAMAFLCAFTASGHTKESGLSRGKVLLAEMCSQCHAVGPNGGSPHAYAPAFRDFGEKLYDEDFTQRLQDGLSTIHPDMPTFHFSRKDAEAAVEYLRSIQAHASKRVR